MFGGLWRFIWGWSGGGVTAPNRVVFDGAVVRRARFGGAAATRAVFEGAVVTRKVWEE